MHSMMFHPQSMGIEEAPIDHWAANIFPLTPPSPFSSYRHNMDLTINGGAQMNMQPPHHHNTASLCNPMDHININSATDLIGHSAAAMLNEGIDSLSDFSDEFSTPQNMCNNHNMSSSNLCDPNYTPPQSVEYDFPPDFSGTLSNDNVNMALPHNMCTNDKNSEGGVGMQFEKASRKTNPHQLPHCKVCNAQATGFHYGVNSCEACKGFFHRSLLRKKPYKCYKSAKCEIRPGKRNVCGQCRYKRCLEVGMSKEGIKTGRYTYEKRTKDIMEIKKDHLQKADAIEKELDSERQQELEAFISRLVHAKEKLLSDVEVVQQTEIGVTAVHKEAPDKLMYIPYESPEPLEDGSNIWRKWASVVENTGGVRRVIKFVKTIPGFRNLEMPDQIQLIKHSFCEIWLIARHKFFNTEAKVYNNKVGFSFDVVKAIGEEESGTLLNVANRLKLLDLSEEEASLMVAFVIFFSDRCSLIEPEQVDSIQTTILEALTFVLHRDFPDDKTRFGKIMSIFIELRSTTEMYHSLSDRALSNIGDIAPLLWEIINLS